MKLFFKTVALIIGTTLSSYSQSNYALDFDGNDDWVDASNGKVSATSLDLPVMDITVESWVYVRQYSTWDAIVGFLQDNGSFEKGWDLEVRGNNKFAFALSTNGSLNYLETTNEFKLNRWYHIAGTYDGVTKKIYVNGVLEAETTVNDGVIDYDDSWLAIGAYKDDNENNAFNGKIDEVRIWNVAKSVDEIRADMCRSLNGSEANLKAYYTMNENSLLTLSDESNHLADGAMTNMEVNDHIISGAAIGDQSVYAYDETDWSNVVLELQSSSNGTGSVSIQNGSPNGVHLYQVNESATVQANYTLVNNSNTYYGVFVAESDENLFSTFQFEHDYSNYPDAVTSENTLSLIDRPNGGVLDWGLNEFNLNATANTITSNSNAYRMEYTLLEDLINSCSIPSQVMLTAQTIDSAGVSWLNGGSGVSNVQWGLADFELGSGTIVRDVSNSNVGLYPIVPGTSYAFYVQDSCSTENSPWVGPYIVTGEICESPTDIVVDNIYSTNVDFNWTSTNNGWVISWGQPGFNVDWGVQTSVSNLPYNLDGLTPETTYEYYVRSVCSGENSVWAGPFQFSTNNSVLGLSELTNLVSVYPNPSKGTFTIVGMETAEDIQIIDMMGRNLQVNITRLNNQVNIELANPIKGTYLLKIVSQDSILTKKIEVR